MNTPTLRTRLRKYLGELRSQVLYQKPALKLVGITVLLGMIGSVNTASAADGLSSQAAEQWVQVQVQEGREANLDDCKAGRNISGSFIKRLLVDNASIKLPRTGVRILNAVIDGPVDLKNEEVHHDARLTNCVFRNEVVFLQTHFHSNLHLEGSTFEAPADFYGSSVAGNFSANNARFLQSAKFELMKVDGHCFLNKAVFQGPVRFYRTRAAENFETNGAEFNDATNDEKSGADFEGLQAHAALFRGTKFQGRVNFYSAAIKTNLEVDNSTFGFAHKFVTLENMTIGGNVFVRGAIFKAGVSFFGSTIAGRLDLKDAHFEDTQTAVFFNGLKTDAIGLENTDFKGPIQLNGMTYHQILSGGGDAMLKMINRATYDDGAYAQLEQYYRQQGNLGQADAVYIVGRRRERANFFFGLRWIGSVLLDVLIRYGRQPWRVVIWSVIIIGIGWYIFRRKAFMEPTEPGTGSQHYHGLLYSLDLFLPIVDLQMASRWQPKDNSRRARKYLPVHVILGWILVTILVAALTGLLK